MCVARAVIVRQAGVGTEILLLSTSSSATGAALSGDRQMLRDQQRWVAAERAQWVKALAMQALNLWSVPEAHVKMAPQSRPLT